MGSQHVHMAEVNTTLYIGAIRLRFLSGQRNTPTPILQGEHKFRFHCRSNHIGMNHKGACKELSLCELRGIYFRHKNFVKTEQEMYNFIAQSNLRSTSCVPTLPSQIVFSVSIGTSNYSHIPKGDFMPKTS